MDSSAQQTFYALADGIRGPLSLREHLSVADRQVKGATFRANESLCRAAQAPRGTAGKTHFFID